MKRFLLLALFAASTVQAQDLPLLETGTAVEGDLVTGDADTYAIELAADRFVYGVADQQTVDVVVKIFGPDGTLLDTFDGPARGPETFTFTTDEPGRYRIEITPFEEEEGDYALVIERAEPVAETPEGKVDQMMAPYDRDDTPGGVVAVFRDGEVAFARAYGIANLSHGIPFTVETVSNIGSVSKQFTAFAIALLEAQGKLSLDDDVRTHIPELPDLGEPVTLRNLLNHTGGYREIYNTMPIVGWGGEDALRRIEAVHLVQHQPELQFPPGSKYTYNNTGYILLAEVVERITEESFPDWMAEHVFGPLGMAHTVVKGTRGQVIPNSAQGYTPAEGGGFREAGDLDASYGAGGIYTTVGDLARWLGNFHDARVGGRAVMDRLVERGVLTDGDTLDYALGLGIGTHRGLTRIQHGGADIAHRALLAYYPEINAGVATLSNHAGFDGGIAGRTAEAFFEAHMQPEDEDEEEASDDGEVEVDPEILDTYTGRFEIEGAPMIITYTRDGDRFYAQATGQPELDLEALTDSTFAYDGINARVTFHRAADGTVDRATHWQGQDVALHRLPPYEPSMEELDAYAGRYYSPELGTSYTLAVEDSQLVARHRRLEDIPLTPKEPDAFTAGSFFFSEVEFQRGGNGAVTGFTLSNSRTTGVVFEKQ